MGRKINQDFFPFRKRNKIIVGRVFFKAESRNKNYRNIRHKGKIGCKRRCACGREKFCSSKICKCCCCTQKYCFKNKKNRSNNTFKFMIKKNTGSFHNFKKASSKEWESVCFIISSSVPFATRFPFFITSTLSQRLWTSERL